MKKSLIALAVLLIILSGAYIYVSKGRPISIDPKSNLAAISGAGSGLYLHYTFEQGSGTVAQDSSGSGTTGNLVGSPSFVSGKVGSYAIALDGTDDYIEIPSAATPRTVAFWVKTPEKNVLYDGPGLVLGAVGDYTDAMQAYLKQNDGTGKLSVQSSSAVLDGSNTWKHIVWTEESGTGKLYVNGSLDKEASFELNPTISAKIVLGAASYAGTPYDFIASSYDDIRLYDRALTSSEVSELYALGSGQSQTSSPVNGSCGVTVNTCSLGSLSDTADSSTEYLWSCVGSNGGSTASCSATISTTDTTAPNISAISSFNVTSSGATVSWATNEASDTQVEYGLTTAYGNQSSLNSSLLTSHSVTLSSLTSNTVYHYRVKSRDAAGNLATSADQTFTTLQASAATYTLTVTKTGSGTVSGGSVSCGSTCTQSSISSGASITLTATPAAGNTFTGWSGGGCSGTGTCTVSVTANTTVTASFAATASGAPDAPSTISGSAIAGNQINISWSPSLGTVEATKYNVYRNGSYIGYVAALAEERMWKDAGFYQDYGLSSNTSYTYYVKAVSSGGTESTASPSITVTTLSSSQNALIPPARSYDWTPGVNVGVPGGIKTRTNVIDVTQASNGGADKTGVSDAGTIINAAIAAAPKDSVIYLPAGRYRLSTPIYITRSDITLKGDGIDVTILDCQSGGCLSLRGQDFYNLPKYKVTSGAYKGSTQITFAGDAAVGDVVSIITKNDPKLPVISPTGFEGARTHKAVIKQKSGNTYTISPAIIFDVDSANTQVEFARPINFVGLESFTVDASVGKPQNVVTVTSTYGSWIKNVRMKGATNYILSLGDNLFCEIRQSHLDEGKASGTNGAGLLMGAVTGCLIEDNFIGKSFPVIEVNFGSTGNVFAYNYLPGSANTNHGAHNSFNLYEGNVTEMFWADGYYGSESEDTFFRNYVNGFGFSIKRFSRNFNIIGNLIDGFHSFGQPNIGNPFSEGFVAPSSGVYWKDWSAVTGLGIKATLTSRLSDSKGVFTFTSGFDRMQNYCSGCLGITVDWGNAANWGNAARYTMSETGRTSSTMTLEGGHNASLPSQGTELGIWPRSEGFQELDLDVASSMLLRGNWYKNGSYRGGFDEGLHGYSLPTSLYLDSKPSWFGTLAWPPYNPSSPNTSATAIPSGYRTINGVEVPGAVGGGNPVPTSFTLTVNKSGVGSGTVTGTGINCGTDCAESSLSSGASVVLTATASSGSTFTGWSGGGCTGTGACTVTISTNTTVTATFTSTAAIDTTAPTISITSPISGSTVSNSVSLAASASDNVAVVGVQFKLDGANLGSELNTAPYSGTWNTLTASKGSHTITATARDAAGNTKTATTTVTVSNTTSTPVSNPGSSTGGGGGGGGGGSTTVVTPAAPFVPTVPQRPAVSANTTTTTTNTTCTAFTRSLSLGSTGDDVRSLQKFLNQNGFTVAASGPGSNGSETTVFGPATAAAVKRFQETYRSETLAPVGNYYGTGTFGTYSQKKANAMLGSCTTAQTASATIPTAAPTISIPSGTVFTTALDIGSTGYQVTLLQTYLAKYPELYPEKLVTGTFGKLTQMAVSRFQEKHGLAKPGDPGYGFVGPKTRAKLNEVWKQ